MKGVEVHGYAIVSADDRIADASGAMPEALRNDADWAYFQAGLDLADWVILGRTSHELTPNPRGRRRLVVSSGSRGLEERGDALWWRPDALHFAEVAHYLTPTGGRFAVPGGQGVFDLFLEQGYTAFHLARAQRVRLPGGRCVFSCVERGESVAAAMRRAALAPSPARWLDAAAEVSLTVYGAGYVAESKS